MGGGETMQFGRTGVNRSEAKAMGFEAFKKAFRGKLDVDMEEAWKLINADEGKGSVSMVNQDGNIPPRKKPNLDKPAKDNPAPAAQ